MPVDYRLGDVIRLVRPHPCGGYDWIVVRLGADIGIRCTTCQRRVLLDRPEVDRRLRSFLSRGPSRDPFGDAPASSGGESDATERPDATP